jgi:gliding motility-associated-like protein
MIVLITSIIAASKTRWRWFGIYALSCFLTFQTAQAQYTVNGDAFSTSCRCYTLTTRTTDFQSGSVWNNNRIDLRQSFDFYFIVNLGCADDGADGIAFVLQPISTSVGSSGGGMGFSGIQPSLGITMDTYQNANPDNDPVFDHMAIQLNGDLNHASPQTISPTVPISATSNNVEDCQDHLLRVVWNANTNLLRIFFDGQLRLSVSRDLVANVFNNNPLVYWGFTGATGGATNIQKFCTALIPKFYFNDNQRLCVNEPVQFMDSTISFSGGVRQYWDFGDGSPIDSLQTNPIHTYAVAGEYTVEYRVVASDGCSSVYQKTFKIGNKPILDFTASPLCTDRVVKLLDRSSVINASIQRWYWKNETTGQTSTQSDPSFTTAQPGEQRIVFAATSSDGCSDTLRRTIFIHPTPTISARAEDICLGDTLIIDPRETTADSMVVGQWFWSTSDTDQYTGIPLKHLFDMTGPASVSVFAISRQGCYSDTLTIDLDVVTTNVQAGPDQYALPNQSVQLVASGALSYLWTPAVGLSNPSISNPMASIRTTQTYVVTGSTTAGCSSTDTVTVFIVENELIQLPNAFSPNGDGLNDLFRLPLTVIRLNQFSIYNRFGQRIFSTNNRNVAWDGRFKGKLQDPGSYVWVLDAYNIRGERKQLKGSIILIR